MGTGERKCFELNDPDSEKMCALALKIIYRLGLVDSSIYSKILKVKLCSLVHMLYQHSPQNK